MSIEWPSTSAALYISGQLMRLNRSVSSDDIPVEMTGYAGGHNRSLQPHITGFHHVLFFLPEILFNMNLVEAQKWLASTCESFTPHTYNINTTDVIGMGQTSVSFPTSRTTNREFTLSFREYQYLPILNTIKTWHSIFDPLSGSCPFGTYMLTPTSVYKGVVIVAITKPSSNNGELDIDDLEEGYIYHGVFPINCPDETVLSSDHTSNEIPLLSVTFKFDGSPLDFGYPGVKEAICELFSDHSYNKVYDKIGVNLPRN